MIISVILAAMDFCNVGGSEGDELMKFKKPADMGAIIQEKFNAKKKQLLGL